MVEFENGSVIKLHKVDNDSLNNTVKKYILPDEEILGVFKTVRDRVIFTDRRVIALDVQGAGARQDITSIPYRTVVKFSVVTTGLMDLDSEVELHLICGESFTFEFIGSKHVPEIGLALAKFCL